MSLADWDQAWPRVSLVFSAFVEERCVRAKVENCLALDYPPDRLEILVGCDGCTDRTAAIAREVGGSRVSVHELFPRAGKASVLSRLVPPAPAHRIQGRGQGPGAGADELRQARPRQRRGRGLGRVSTGT